MTYTFQGFPRRDGTVGTRNHIGIIPSVICSSEAARDISEKVPGAVAITHLNGCAQLGDDFHVTKDILVGVTKNPNIYSSLFVGLGCEHNQVGGMLENAPEKKQTEGITIQNLGGHKNTVEKGLETVEKWVEEAELEYRQEVQLSSITIGVLNVEQDERSLQETGPLMGKVIDQLVENNVNIITGITKTLEPAGDKLALRAENTEMKNKLESLAKEFRRHSWGNVEGNSLDMTPWTEEEIKKAGIEAEITGTKKINSLLNYGDAPHQQGFHLMRVPTNIVEAMAGMAAAGCGLVLIVSSRGIFTGSSILPCMTISPAYSNDFQDMVDYAVTTEETERQVSPLIEKLLQVCSGEKTNLEELELGEFSISHAGTTF